MTSACHTFFSLPELVCRLSQFLRPHDLIQLLQTNHSINSICTPEFWRTLDLFHFRTPEKLLTSPDFLTAFSNNVDSIKSISWRISFSSHYINAVWAFLNTTTLSPAHQSISTDVLSHPTWGTLKTPTDSSIHPLPPMLRLTQYHGELRNSNVSSIFYLPPLSSRHQYNYVYPHHPHHTLWLLRVNRSTLTHLNLSEVPLSPSRILRDICRTFSQLDRLRTLRLGAPWGHYISRQGFCALFSSCPRSLVEFSIQAEVEVYAEDTGLNPNEDDWDFDQGPLALSDEPFHRLTKLRLPNTRKTEAIQAVVLVPTLMLCPALESLRMPPIKNAEVIEMVATALRLWCPRITDLSLINDASLTEGGDDVMSVVQQISEHRLQNIHIGNCLDNTLPSTTAAAFLRHAESLRHIEIKEARLLKSATIQTILVSCRGLEYLKILEGQYMTESCLHLEDAVETEWVCTRIRHLEIIVKFTDDGRDPKYFASDPTMATWTEEDRKHWRMIDGLYTQIGALSELEILKLKASGTPRPEVYLTPRHRQRGVTYQDTCLPGLLSLEDSTTGKIGFLSRLSGLTKLRELRGSLFWTNREVLARTGEREVEWFVNHLPMLRRMVLLFFPDSNIIVHGGPQLPWVIGELQKRRPGLVLESDRMDTRTLW